MAVAVTVTADAEGPPDEPDTLHDGTLEYQIFDYRWEDRETVQVFYTWDTPARLHRPPAPTSPLPRRCPTSR